MDCKRAEQLLPLHAGGDLEDGRESARLSAHLEGCAACRRLADEWADSMSLLRLEDAPGFDAAFFDPIHRNVMREIKATRETPPAFAALLLQLLRPKQLANAVSLALVCAALLVALRLSLSPQPSKTAGGGVAASVNRQISPDRETPEETPHEGTARKDERTETRARELQTRKARPATRESAAVKKTAPRVVEEGPDAPELLVASAEPVAVKDEREMLKIDLQTSDPDVRIIWFSPQPEVTSSPRSTNDKR